MAVALIGGLLVAFLRLRCCRALMAWWVSAIACLAREGAGVVVAVVAVVLWAIRRLLLLLLGSPSESPVRSITTFALAVLD